MSDTRAGASEEGAEEMPEWERELLEQQAAADLAAAAGEATATETVEVVEAVAEPTEEAAAVEEPVAEAAAVEEPTAEAAEVVETTETTTTEENN